MILKKHKKSILILSFLAISFTQVFSNESKITKTSSIESTSKVNWISRDFSSDLKLDVQKLKIQLPSGKKIASKYEVATKIP